MDKEAVVYRERVEYHSAINRNAFELVLMM